MLDNWDKLIEEDDLDAESRLRKKSTIEQKVDSEDVHVFEENNWTIKRQYKNYSAMMIRNKNASESLIDRLWTIFYKMGFSLMNPSGQFEVQIDNKQDVFTKKVDIVAMDDETCLFIDCFASEQLNRTKSFKDEIIAIREAYRVMVQEVREKYGDKKCKYILATTNYLLSDDDFANLEGERITYFDEEKVDYYYALVEHLGSAARYQLLGNLFRHTTIKGMDERVPAIEGRMGDLTYYSFLIEPERLLKIGYVLHRNKANHDQMPTYQRLIKKERLKSIREYVNNGGFFPNSLIISIDSKGKKLRFERGQQSMQGEHSRVGILYLPKEYQSAYIIDGQHRLYGYSDSKFAGSDTLPVIAFIDLDKDKQVKMFMDINENQKPVSKTLRNILNIDLNWNSDNLTKRREAIILNVGQALGENPNSPLFGRIVTGEDSINEKRCITIEYIKAAIDKTNFLNRYNKKNEVVERGIIDTIESEEAHELLYNYLRKCLLVIAELCHEEWDKGSSGFLTINNTITGVIRVIADISNITIKKYNMSLNNLDLDELYQKSGELLMNFATTINDMSTDAKNEIKTAKGGGAKEIAWRKLQVALYNKDESFRNQDLERYIEENCVDYNTDGWNEILFVKDYIINGIKNKFVDLLDWESMYISEDLAIKLHQKIAAEETRNKRAGNEVKLDIWDVMSFDDVCKILNHRTNWSTMLKELFSKGQQSRSRGDIISYIKATENSEHKIENGKKITKSEYLIVDEFYQYLKGEEA